MTLSSQSQSRTPEGDCFWKYGSINIDTKGPRAKILPTGPRSHRTVKHMATRSNSATRRKQAMQRKHGAAFKLTIRLLQRLFACARANLACDICVHEEKGHPRADMDTKVRSIDSSLTGQLQVKRRLYACHTRVHYVTHLRRLQSKQTDK